MTDTKQSRSGSLYAVPQAVEDPAGCYFYHTMEIPGHGTIPGDWDLRGGLKEYLGGVEVRGKRVLDVGAASGCVSFYAESEGAEVVSYDLSDGNGWDIVPYARLGDDQFRLKVDTIRRLNRAYWFCHRATGSKAKMVFGTVYAIPREIGDVDVSIFGSILLHVRDPFLALQSALSLTRETAVIAEPLKIPSGGRPVMEFVPDSATAEKKETWWLLTPEIIQRFIAVLGFARSEVFFHTQKYQGGIPVKYFTVVGHRTEALRPEPEK
ncbi:MAG TPA: hypothetical protein PKL97_01770 [Candidatus Omnitrophota bacterium]|nr:hypothetical protein [Candidatus Omnitrophota bacterium]